MRGTPPRAVAGLLLLVLTTVAARAAETSANPEAGPFAPPAALEAHIREALTERWHVRRTVQRLGLLEDAVGRQAGTTPDGRVLEEVAREVRIFVERGREARLRRLDAVRERVTRDQRRVERLHAAWAADDEAEGAYQRERLARDLVDAHRAWRLDQAQLGDLEAGLAWLEVLEEELAALTGRADPASAARLVVVVRHVRELEEGRMADLERRIEEDRRRRALGGEA